MTYHAFDQPSLTAEMAERAYRAGQRSVINTVRLTADSVGPALTMANALQKAIRAYREHKADPTDPDLRERAMRQVELYEMHRNRLVVIESTRRVREALDEMTRLDQEMGLWP